MKAFKAISILLIITLFQSCSYNQNWKQLQDRAKTFQERGNIEVSVELLIKAKAELKKDSADTKTLGALCNDLAFLYWDLQQHKKSIQQLLEEKQIREKLSLLDGVDSDYADCYSTLAAVTMDM